MKIFQIVDNIVHYDMTHLYSSIEVARSKYPSAVQIVEAPDYVFEGWGFNPNENGDNRFIKPTPPEGFLYDEKTGTFYDLDYIVHEQIGLTKMKLAESDYKIIKCYEYSLVGAELPYDIQALHEEREALRTLVNELEAMLPVSPELHAELVERFR